MYINKVLVVIASFNIVFFAFAIRYTYGMLLPEMMAELNLTNTQAGAIYMCFFALYIFLALIVGFLVDIKSIKKIIIFFLPFMGVGTVLMGLTSSYITSIVFFSIVGIGSSICWVPIVVWSQKTYQLKRGFVLGILQIGCSLGWGTLGLILPYLISWVGWRGVWKILGILSLMLTLPPVLFAYEPEAKSGKINLIKHFKKFSMIVRSTKFLLGGMAYTLTSFAIMIHLTYFKAYAVFEMHLSSSLATSLYGIVGLISILGSLFVLLYTDKIGTFISLIICNLILATGLLLMIYSTYITLPILFVGISYGMIWPLYAVLVKDLFKWEVIGSVMGVWTLMCGIGLSSSSLIGGIIADIYKSYKPPYILGSTLALISLLIITILQQKVFKPNKGKMFLNKVLNEYF